MATGLHASLALGEMHRPHNWEYANASAREGATGFVSSDVGKLALQLDTFGLWCLMSTAPTWKDVGSSGGDLTPDSHKTIRQLIHMVNEGPSESSYREVTGTVFPSAITWYNEDSPAKKKIFEKLLTYTGAFPTTIVWKVYDASETLLATCTDTITYSGAFETERTRVIS